jgi:glycopeptide antibiotics resistance protein
MKKRERVETVFLYGIFIFYILLLMQILFLSRISLLELFSSQRIINRSINLLPFHSIAEYLSGSSEVTKFAFGNVVGNIVLFVPLGLYLPVFKKDKRVLMNLLLVVAVSFSAEVIQGLLGIGTADIDDIILNGFGGLVGILGYRLFLLIVKDQKKVRTAITILSAVIGSPVLFYLFFMMRMRF